MSLLGKEGIQVSQICTAIKYAEQGHKVVVSFSKDLKKKVRVSNRFPKIKNNLDLVVTIGRLNVREEKFVKMCKKAGTKPKAVWFPKG